jgi:hypothetical protein
LHPHLPRLRLALRAACGGLPPFGRLSRLARDPFCPQQKDVSGLKRHWWGDKFRAEMADGSKPEIGFGGLLRFIKQNGRGKFLG